MAIKYGVTLLQVKLFFFVKGRTNCGESSIKMSNVCYEKKTLINF